MLMASSGSAYAQFITVLLIFVAILGVTAWVTKWLADYQKSQSAGRNVEVIESTRIANGQWIQIVRIGEVYKAIAVSKDHVTYLGDVEPESLKENGPSGGGRSFHELLVTALKKDNLTVPEKGGSDDGSGSGKEG